MSIKIFEQIERAAVLLLGVTVAGAIAWCRSSDSPTIKFIGLIAAFCALSTVVASHKLESKPFGVMVGALSFCLFTFLYLALAHYI